MTNSLKLIFKSISDGIQLRRKLHQTEAELNALSDKELADIGISRYDISAIARAAVFNG